MAVHYRTLGLVIKKENRQDSDRMFTVFAKDFGRIEIFAKSIRAIASKLKGGIELFGVCELEFIQGKHKKTLTDARLVGKFANIYALPEKFEVASTISALLESFIKNPEADPLLWDFLLDIFGKLDDTTTNDKFLYYYFFWNFVAMLGYTPQLSACAHCDQSLQPANLYFSNQEGGIICANCYAGKKEGIRIMPDAIKVLRLIISKDWELLAKLKVSLPAKKNLQHISHGYRNYLLDTLT